MTSTTTTTTTSKYQRILGLLLVLAIALYFKFGHMPGLGSADRIDEKFVAGRDLPRVQSPQRTYVPPDTSTIHGVARDVWIPPKSNWLSNEKNAAANILKRLGPTILVVPVQGDRNAFDFVERSLMTRLVSNHIGLAEEAVVLPTSQVLRYFGTNKAMYTESDIRELARLTSSDRVLVMHAEHNRNGGWELQASVFDENNSQIADSRTWTDLSYSDEEPPSVGLTLILEELAEFATGDSEKQKKRKYNFDVDEFAFPDSVDDLLSRSERSPLHAAAYLQFIGALHPHDDFNETRNFLFERSLVQLQYVAPGSPYYKYFKARAYAYLGRRPAAVAELGVPSNDYESSLLSYLNGNLLDLRESTAKLGETVVDYMVWRDLFELEWIYRKMQDRAAPMEFFNEHPVWAKFVQRSLQDYEDWSSYSMVDIKLGLEDLLPVDGESIRDRAATMFATNGDLDELDLTRLVLQHIEAFSAGQPQGRDQRLKTAQDLSAIDVLQLAESIAIANHIGRIEDNLVTRDRPEAALREIAKFEPLFSGHPAITILKGRALEEMADKSDGLEKENLQTLSADALLSGFAWTGDMTRDAAFVARRYGHLLLSRSYGGPRTSYRGFLSVYSRRYFEWPNGPNWYSSISTLEGVEDALERCINYRPTAFFCLRHLIDARQQNAEDPESIRDSLLASYSNRFQGNPLLAQYEVEVARYSADQTAEIELLRAQIGAGDAAWETYKQLGQRLIRIGKYTEAQELWLSFPGFLQSSNLSAVRTSRYAELSGSTLYWVGQHELARPLLELAVGFGSGSEPYMSAGQRVALIGGEIENAMAWSAERVRRYSSIYGLRDLMQLLHASGESEMAWSIFDDAQASKQNSQMWSGALVGHRAGSASIAEISDWIEESKIRRNAIADGADRKKIHLAPRYLLMAGTMDRIPSPGFADIVDAAHSRPKSFYVSHRAIVDENGVEVKGRTADLSGPGGHMKHDALIPSPRDERHAEYREEIDHRYTMLAAAMTAFANEDFRRAFELFNETAYFYLLDEYLPYYAFSAAAIGRADHLPNALRAREDGLEEIRRNERRDRLIAGYRFDEDLSYAVLASFRGDHDAAIGSMKDALNNKPYIESRSVYPMYQLVDLADRLYEQTGEAAYRDFALDLSRRHTVILPMYAWAYFVVAKYSRSTVEQIENTASGLKLDPLSSRLESLSDDVVAKAKEHLAKHGPPFLSPSNAEQVEST